MCVGPAEGGIEDGSTLCQCCGVVASVCKLRAGRDGLDGIAQHCGGVAESAGHTQGVAGSAHGAHGVLPTHADRNAGDDRVHNHRGLTLLRGEMDSIVRCIHANMKHGDEGSGIGNARGKRQKGTVEKEHTSDIRSRETTTQVGMWKIMGGDEGNRESDSADGRWRQRESMATRDRTITETGKHD
jgi:hypothetical protein